MVSYLQLPRESITYFVGGGVSETGEKRKEPIGDRCAGCVSEDDLVQMRRRFNLVEMLTWGSLSRVYGYVPCPHCSSTASLWCRRDGRP
jgi:hypothetical protein